MDTKNKCQDVECAGVVAFVIVLANHHEDVCFVMQTNYEMQLHLVLQSNVSM